ncbi:uncharacterized protein LOC128392860 isoform X1 [Panonychus citri]|uniref:uncharacterized protein LOC128392860 isoform X1 n=1 Tax=Panonychus citri TaxID=50023 RepID=UPI002307C27C|nr:uncharacterized protein LOC128392860 isoform X1 [Panonychus citri]
MNFSFFLISVLCVSTIGAAPFGNPDDVKKFVKEFVNNFETTTQGWKIDSSLEHNVIQQIEQRFDDGYTPDWNPQLSDKENLVNLIINYGRDQDLPYPGITQNSTLYEVIEVIPKYFPIIELTDEQAALVAQVIIDVIVQLQIRGLNVYKPLRVNVETIVANSIDEKSEKTNSGVLEASFEEVITNAAINALKLFQFEGYSSESTLHDNVNTFLDEFSY